MELELPFRATLELCYRRGLPDESIAAVAGLEEDQVAHQRERAIDWLARRSGRGGPDARAEVEDELRALPAAGWRGEESGGPVETSPAEGDVAAASEEAAGAEEGGSEVASPIAPAADEPRPFPRAPAEGGEDDAERRRRWPLLLATALAAAVLVVAIVLAAEDSGDPGAGAGSAAGTSTEPSAGGDGSPQDHTGPGAGAKPAGGGQGSAPSGGEGAAAAVGMAPVPGAEVEGRVEASLSGSGPRPVLRLDLGGFPERGGQYRAWLYSSVIDATSLGFVTGGSGSIRARLPDGWERYPFVDISLQEPGQAVHSGRSVARIATQDLGPS